MAGVVVIVVVVVLILVVVVLIAVRSIENVDEEDAASASASNSKSVGILAISSLEVLLSMEEIEKCLLLLLNSGSGRGAIVEIQYDMIRRLLLTDRSRRTS